ncbi:MAG: 50S ribosomal protein L25 [Rectinema sp.]|jgi:large subunit ribosomal protein L25|uniref:Large ribosomal subunit protein bL25 n=1 Tax=uncultured spirochete TaxID=156406 RepID=A0A3P3XUW5_9SPIR|nr:50S ribosomal protein L25 [uncultured spirochete]
MEHIELKVSPREKLTKGELNKARKSGRVPAQLYGKEIAPMSIFLERDDFVNVARRVTESMIIDLNLEGKKYAALMKEIQKENISGEILHIDFNLIERGRRIRVKVPLHLVGSAKGVREGGILEHAIHDIEVECEPDVLPEKIEIDISGLEVNHALHLRDVAIPEGVKLLTNPETVIAIIKFARAEVEQPAQPEVAEAEGEVPEQAAAEGTSEAVQK